MVSIITFVVIYFLSLYFCKEMDEQAGIEGSLLRYIPVLNTLTLLIAFIGGWIWDFIDWIRK